jgi:hypothetical protein
MGGLVEIAILLGVGSLIKERITASKNTSYGNNTIRVNNGSGNGLKNGNGPRV